jgi:uncharacterized membrane protein HdeD (DUF308 family)
MGMVAIMVLLTTLVRVETMGLKHASHWLMAGSGTVTLLAALIMLAARRPLAEILVMAMLGVLVCQCVMDNFHIG